MFIRVVVAGALLAACAEPPSMFEMDIHQDKEEWKDIPVAINCDLDLLFVIDTSSSMADDQAILAATFPLLMERLDGIPSGIPNLHVGVITMDPADGGRLQATPRLDGCAAPSGAYLEHVARRDGTLAINYGGALADALPCIAMLGADGTALARPFAMVERALDGSVAANDGFLRDDAYLMVVFVTDGDDTSSTSPERFAEILRGVKGDDALILVGAIVDEPAPRIEAVLAQFPYRNRRASLRDEPSAVFEILEGLVKTTLGAPCLNGDLADLEPDVPGLQFECVASEIVDFGTAEQAEDVLADCDGTELPCWRLVADPTACSNTPTQLILEIERGGASVPAGTHVQLRCVTE